MKKRLHIAIDGPVAAGKGSVASNVAQKLNILYFDTGAMYRAVALIGMRNDTDLDDVQGLLSLLKTHKITQRPQKKGAGTVVHINDEDVSQKIREEVVSEGSSIVSKYPKIRTYLVEKQKALIKDRSVVMEGRDITTVVMPDADIKIYLTASIDERARRRHKELQDKGLKVQYKKILEEMTKRDYRDFHRSASPLIKAHDAIELDTTSMSIDQVVDTIYEYAKKVI